MVWTAKEINGATSSRILYFRDYIRRAEKARLDSDRLARDARGECRYCYYVLTSMAGQAFTSYACAHCGELRDHHNTAVPKICIVCSYKLRVCRRCGGLLQWSSEP